MFRFGEAEGQTRGAVQHSGQDGLLLLVGAEIAHHQHLREIADDRAFVLQVVVQAEALGRQMLADDRHGEIADVLAAKLLGQREPQETRLVGAAAHLAQQVFPLLARQPAMLEIGARPFAAMIEEAVVVVLFLQRHDLAFDEIVDACEQVRDFFWDRKVHVLSPWIAVGRS